MGGSDEKPVKDAICVSKSFSRLMIAEAVRHTAPREDPDAVEGHFPWG